MLEQWSIRRRITAGFSLLAFLAIATSSFGIYAIGHVTEAKDRVIEKDSARRLRVEEMRVLREKRAKAVRSYIITGKDKYVEDARGFGQDLARFVEELDRTSTDPIERAHLNRVTSANHEMQAAWDRLIAHKQANSSSELILSEFSRGQDQVKVLEEAMSATAAWEDEHLRAASQAATDVADGQRRILAWVAAAVGLMAAALAYVLGRALSRSIGTAVSDVQSSSAELQAAASQQVVSSQELAASTTEIGTTIRELLATAKQIAESAQRVARIAQETGSAVADGDQVGKQAHDANVSVRTQVDVIVHHMVDLGRKSQQIGSILDLVNELSEQTNILSINATIEAAGAGEAGRRFGVVADEIRKLAERTTGAAREIRGLVEEIRAAANTTVMATEDGRKAVDSSALQFGEALRAFERVSEHVSVTVDAAREIELSTRQQSAAVEQVSLAIGNVAQAAKETESSTAQTLATAAQLAEVSRNLKALLNQSSPELRA